MRVAAFIAEHWSCLSFAEKVRIIEKAMQSSAESAIRAGIAFTMDASYALITVFNRHALRQNP